MDLGVTEKVARDIVKNYKKECIEDRINDVINNENIENLPAFLVKSIKENWELSPETKKGEKKN